MTVTEAKAILVSFNKIKVPTDKQEFAFTEACEYLINETKDPHVMMELGGWYYGKREFDLALHYYEMAEAFGLEAAATCLGYIWYYGRTGQKDFEKAYQYYRRSMELGSPVGAYKVSDCLKNGYGVEKDEAEAIRIIQDLYFNAVPKMKYINEPVPEICIRYAEFRRAQQKTDAALKLYYQAKGWLAQRLRYNGFFGNISIMRGLIADIYSLTPFNPFDFDFYGLFEVLKKPCTVTFRCDGKDYAVKSERDGENVSVFFAGKWYRSVAEFMQQAHIGNLPATMAAHKCYNFEVK